MFVGSDVATEEVPSISPLISNLRAEHVASSVFIKRESNLKFAQNYDFNSPS